MAHLGKKRTHLSEVDSSAAPQPAEMSDAELFASAIEGAQPLASRQRVPTARSMAAVKTTDDAPAPRMVVERNGEQVEGRAHGVSRQQLTELRRGVIRPEARLDLHHCTVDTARQRLGQFITNSHQAGRACVLVVPGRGLHSTDGPVLKGRVVEWLSAGSLSPKIRGFCTARPADGGAGALYVLLTSTAR